MSTLTIQYNDGIYSDLPTNKSFITELIDSSAKILIKKPNEIIINFQTIDSLKSINSPTILIRGETSLSKRMLIKNWGEELLKILKKYVVSENIRLAVKTYVVDSEWVEMS